jgi:hypothetical protein
LLLQLFQRTRLDNHSVLDHHYTRSANSKVLFLDLNPDITVGKFIKRLKLAHSKTTAAGVLPKGSVKILPEVRDVHNIADFDGCGLISRECLDFVWTEYCKAEQSKKLPADQDLDFMEISKCPYTGFQGRLGGFKGAWVLDESLGEGIKMHVRPESAQVQASPEMFSFTS